MAGVYGQENSIRFYDLSVWDALSSLRMDMIELMVKNRRNFNFIDESVDLAPVQMAVALENRVALDLMRSVGADVLIRNNRGENIVDVAQRCNVSDEMFDYAYRLWSDAHEALVTDEAPEDDGPRGDIINLARKRREKTPSGPN